MSIPLLFLFLFVSACTSMLSAAIGMAGGTVLLSFLTFFYGYQELIPLHAASQLVSNGVRAWMLRGFVQRGQFYFFAIGSVLGVVGAVLFLGHLPSETWPSLLIASFVLYEVFKPKKALVLRVRGPAFILVGVGIGFLSMFVGATGILLGAFILGLGGTKEETVANQALMQTFNHACKVLGFFYLGWRAEGQGLAFLAIFIGALIGTRFGVRILEKLPTKFFFWLFRAVLILSAVKIIWTELPRVLSTG